VPEFVRRPIDLLRLATAPAERADRRVLIRRAQLATRSLK